MELIAYEGTGIDENYETMTDCSGKKSERTTQIDKIKTSQYNLNKKLIKFMTMMQKNFESIGRINDDITDLKKNMAEGQEKIDHEHKVLKARMEELCKIKP